MKITVLAENVSAHENIGAEHGLSLYIETSEHKILFDMGQSSLFTENAEKLGVDLSDIDAAVLSHGHYDHGGGLGEFLELNRTAPVYLSRFAFEPHYNGTEKYIGLDTSLAKSDRLIFTDDSCKIGEGLTLFTCNSFDKKH
ncbi:MAG: MBL fold metallo-hydrolase, partial [Oscillospiraceae bacterium]|nr:MBL fold metallo-hydrolase [Oscillospiraceae bacterium]